MCKCIVIASHFNLSVYFWQMTEYARLEEKLQKTLIDLEKREKQLVANEQEVCTAFLVRSVRFLKR